MTKAENSYTLLYILFKYLAHVKNEKFSTFMTKAENSYTLLYILFKYLAHVFLGNIF